LPCAEREDAAPRALNLEKIYLWPLRIDFESTTFKKKFNRKIYFFAQP